MNEMNKEHIPYLIIDGHSIIFAWKDLRILHDHSQLAAREKLIHRMTGYQDCTGERVIIVFDGKGTKTESHCEQDGIQVFFSKKGVSADQIIERLVGKYGRKKKITIASRDKAVLDTCSSFGALAISPNSLREFLENAEEKLRKKTI
jgi:predicted RNA-binding protein with PIN domain|tara:strand:+ start:117 stop:557 length:441 start_codon:yes stop_codon:yes gene_type:complete